MSEELSKLIIGRICACLGPQATDPYCPCRMQREGLDGFFNCHGDKEAMARREKDAQERLSAAMASLSERATSRSYACTICYGNGVDVAGRPCPFAPHKAWNQRAGG